MFNYMKELLLTGLDKMTGLTHLTLSGITDTVTDEVKDELITVSGCFMHSVAFPCLLFIGCPFCILMNVAIVCPYCTAAWHCSCFMQGPR